MDVRETASERILNTRSFMGEETYTPGTKLAGTPTFIVDPIDGTTNFVHSYPYVSISLGFTVAREPVVGVVYNPFTGTLFSAIKNKGAYKTERAFEDQPSAAQQLPLKDEKLERLNKALVAIEWGSDRSGKNYECKTKTFANLGRSEEEGGAMVHSARSLGSAALNICGVAEGSLDAYWEGGVSLKRVAGQIWSGCIVLTCK